MQFGKISVPEDAGKVKKGGKNLVNLLKKAEEKEKRLNELRQANGDVSGASVSSVCAFVVKLREIEGPMYLYAHKDYPSHGISLRRLCRARVCDAVALFTELSSVVVSVGCGGA